MAHHYDLIVIGAGTAAMGASTRVRAAGWKVAVVDFRPFGGTCAFARLRPQEDADQRHFRHRSRAAHASQRCRR